MPPPSLTGGALGQALEGVKVVEFTQGMAGPWIGRFMAWCGAEVIRVESHKRPGVVRLYVPPRDREGGVQPELSPWFTDWDAGKLFVALDLTRPEANLLARRLVARADIVVENNASGVMQKLDLDWPALRAVNDALIMLSSNGYGDSGPYRRYVSWGPNIEAMAGMGYLSGFPERSCTMTQYAYPDGLSALHGLFAIMCALDHRQRTGQGQHIELSQLEATVGMIGPQILEQLMLGREPAKLGNGAPQFAPQACYRCHGEDRWCAISVQSESEWHALCRVLTKDEWIDDPHFHGPAARRRQASVIDAAIEAWCGARTPHQAMHALQQAGVRAGAVQDTEDQYERDPHLAARGYFERVPHYKRGEVVAPGVPLGLTETPGHTASAGASIGHDNRYVFQDLLGLSPEEIDDLEACGAIEPEGPPIG